MKTFVRAALALASVAMVAPSIAEAQGKPVVAVLYYDNASLGKDRADYDGVGKGIAEMLITDMASNPNITVVERERVQALLTEQNLTKSGAIDPTTAIRLGKLIGAQYMITGTFISDGKGRFVVTSRVVNVQTSQITNPVRIDDRGDDVLGLIAKLSTKLNTELKLPALRVGDAGSIGAVPAGQPAYVAPTPAPVAEVSKPAAIDVSKDKPVTQVAQAKSSRKMDMKTAMLYSKALEEEDAGNKSKAIDLYRQVDVKFPEYAPVQRKIRQLSQG